MGTLLSDRIYRAKEHSGPFSTLVAASAAELDVLRQAVPGIPEAFYEFAREIGLGQTSDEHSIYMPRPAVEVLNHTSARLYNGGAMQQLRSFFGAPFAPPPRLDLTRIYEFCHNGASWCHCFVPHLDGRVYTLDFSGPTLEEGCGEDFVTFIEGLLETAA